MNLKNYYQNQSGAVLILVTAVAALILPGLWLGYNYVNKLGTTSNLSQVCNALLTKYVETRPSGSSEETTPETTALSDQLVALEDDFNKFVFTVEGEGNLSATYTTPANEQPTFRGTLSASYNTKFASVDEEEANILERNCNAVQRFKVTKTTSYSTKQIVRTFPTMFVKGGFTYRRYTHEFGHAPYEGTMEYLNTFDMKMYVVAKNKEDITSIDADGNPFRWLIYSSKDTYKNYMDDIRETGSLDYFSANYRSILSEPPPFEYNKNTIPKTTVDYYGAVRRQYTINGAYIGKRSGGFYTIDCADYKNNFQKFKYLDFFNGERISSAVSGGPEYSSYASFYPAPVGGHLELQFWFDDKHGATYELDESGKVHNGKQYYNSDHPNFSYWDNDIMDNYSIGQYYRDRIYFYGTTDLITSDDLRSSSLIRLGQFYFENQMVVEECKDVPEEMIESTRPIAIII